MAIIGLRPGIIRSIVGRVGSTIFRRGLPHAIEDSQPLGSNKLSATAPAVPPARRRVSKQPDPAREYWTQGTRCPCHAWARADWIWTHGGINKALWSAAVKRPHMSGYDLWMKEAVSCAARGIYFPDIPSRSGGWSTGDVIPGTTWQPPADCVRGPSGSCVVNAYVCWDAPHLYLDLYLYDAPQHPLPQGLLQLALRADIHGILAPIIIDPMVPQTAYSQLIDGADHNAAPLWTLTIRWLDGTTALWQDIGWDHQLTWISCIDAGSHQTANHLARGPWK